MALCVLLGRTRTNRTIKSVVVVVVEDQTRKQKPSVRKLLTVDIDSHPPAATIWTGLRTKNEVPSITYTTKRSRLVEQDASFRLYEVRLKSHVHQYSLH